MLNLLNKGNGIATNSATEAIKAVIRGIDGKGRCFLAVERTKTFHISACASQRNVTADKMLNIVSHDYLVNNFFANQEKLHLLY